MKILKTGDAIYFNDSAGSVVKSSYIKDVTEFFVGTYGIDFFSSPEESKMMWDIENGKFIKNCGNCEACNLFKEVEPCNSCHYGSNWQLKIW